MQGISGQDSKSVARVGRPAPSFSARCTWAGGQRHDTGTLEDYVGSWLLLIFYPRDFTFVCPAELIAFSSRFAELRERNCRILAVSVDSLRVHREWLSLPRTEGGLGPLRFPLASDPTGEIARAYGVWNEERQMADRGLFIIDPDGVLQYQLVHNLSIGRDPGEVLRVVDALREGGLCPPSWTLGDGTIDPLQELGPGRVLGNYQIQELVGEGGFARVFCAHDRTLERTVALKVIKAGNVVDLERVRAEARVIAAVNHPNICTVHAVEEDAGLPFLVMEYCGGSSLARLLRSRRLEDGEVRHIAGQVAAGLAAAHAAGVAHGDIKPSNIALGDGGRVRILDFGIGVVEGEVRPRRWARGGRGRSDDVSTVPLSLAPAGEVPERDPDPSPRAARRPRVMIRGTPAYMSPEQLRGEPATAATDVFGFGLVLYEMVTGERAVRAGEVEETLQRARELRASQLLKKLPVAYRAIVGRALRRDPAGRPTMRELCDLLREVAAA